MTDAKRLWLCDVQDIPDRQARGFDPAGRGQDLFFVVRRGDRLHAWRNACPHIDGAPMAWRRHAYLSHDGEAIVCHAHGARFDIETGVCVLGPCLGETLERVALTVHDNGEVHVLAIPDLPDPQETSS